MNLTNAYMKNCSVKNANLNGIEFGKLPDLLCNSSINCMSINNKTIALGTDDGVVQLWDFSHSLLLKQIDHESAVYSVCFS